MTPSPTNTYSDEALPALYKAADSSSVQNQNSYIWYYKADLVALVLGSLLSLFNTSNPVVNQFTNVLGAILICVSILFTAMISQKSYKQIWYGGRAVAESIKTLAWRYMANAVPFVNSLTTEQADQLLLQSLRDVLREEDKLSLSISGKWGNNIQITDVMRKIRDSSYEIRKNIYLKDRIQNQQQWYSNKSQTNYQNERTFFILIFLAQICTLVASILVIALPTWGINPTGMFSSLTTALLAWLQVRQYQELSQSYSVASHELGLIAEQWQYIKNEEEFARFVADAENAISREHTLWLARRDVLPK